MKTRITILCTWLLLVFEMNISAVENPKDSLRDIVLRKVFDYASTVKSDSIKETSNYAYNKGYFNIQQRNFLLMGVPTMMGLTRGEREFVFENYNHVVFHAPGKFDSKNLATSNTIRHHRRAMSVNLKFLTPEIYHKTIFQGHVFSPFHTENQRFYNYRAIPLIDGTVQIFFIPFIRNTQLVSGSAIISPANGQIISTHLNGEFDIINYEMILDMNEESAKSLLPNKVKFDGYFGLLGNKIRAHYLAKYGLTLSLPDTLRANNDSALMSHIRPIALNREEVNTYKRFYKRYAQKDTASADTAPKKQNFAKSILWDMIGANLFTRIKGRFGHDAQGYYRIYPIFNPLFMGYSPTNGIYYKFDLRGSYDFSDIVKLSLRLKAGYVFKQHRFYFKLPVNLQYNTKHHGYINFEVGNGNRIFNSLIAQDLRKQFNDSIIRDITPYYQFKNAYAQIVNHYDIASHWGFECGIIYHRRSAVYKQAYKALGRPSTYSSFAPMAELIWRPWGWSGPIVTANYEKAIPGMFKSNIEYDKWEFDAQYIHRLKRMKSLQLRIGSGFYTHKGKHWYFLDYNNFRENIIPGGWDDDFSGEFELLRSEYYNASKYYIRGNLTYETPFFIACYLPAVGRYIERERIYASGLMATELHPYTEFGYGFTTRLFTMGSFVAFKNRKYSGVGFKFGLELFRRW